MRNMLYAGLGLAALIATAPARAEEAKAPQPAQVASAAQYQPQSIDDLAAKYIPFMSQPVSVTLNPLDTPVREVTPQDYQQKVYGSSRPSLVLFTFNECAPCEGIASVFRALAEKYSGDVNFFVVYEDKWPKVDPLRSNSGSLLGQQEGLTAGPSIVMYAPFDVIKGETHEKNPQRIKKIDIIKGGVVKTNEFSLAYDIVREWIETNVITPGEHIVRLNNSFNPIQVRR